MLRSHKIRSTFYTEITLRKLLCKQKYRVATEDKNNIVYKIDYSKCQVVYFGESKRSLKLRSNEHKRSVRNCDCDKNEIAKLQLFLIRRFYCFRKGPHISFKYVQHNHLHYPMMGEVSAKT